MGEVIKNRYEFVVLFDVENGNPNGDPDAGNMPRIDPESGLGIVTDVCLKRKIRNYIETVKEDEDGYKIYIKENVPLNRSDREACKSLGINDDEDKKVTEALKKLKKSDKDADIKLRDYMCRNFYDIRAFGAVMTTFVKASLNCGQVRGPVQLGFARSIDPVISQEVTITRVAITTEKDAVRLMKFSDELKDIPLYVLPVKPAFLFDDTTVFNNLMIDFVRNFKLTIHEK